MAVDFSTHRLTYQDLLELPDDGKRHEILDGAHFVLETPYLRHQRVSGRLMMRIYGLQESSGLGETLIGPFNVVLSEHDVALPDILFVSEGRKGIVTEENIQGAPDLMIEIVSPDTRTRDFGLKRDRYERFGVEEYWVADPDGDTVSVFRREGNRFADPLVLSASADDRLTTPLLPGLEIRLGDVFAR
jgi:Uma2 family endonuclease